MVVSSALHTSASELIKEGNLDPSAC